MPDPNPNLRRDGYGGVDMQWLALVAVALRPGGCVAMAAMAGRVGGHRIEVRRQMSRGRSLQWR